MVLKKHDSEVDLILDDIRDSLLPNKVNPDCTFITRRQDKRLQERLIDISERAEDVWSGLVYSRDQEQSATGWQNITPYPKYVDRLKVQKENMKRTRQTNPVDNSTIVRHLQERIRKWADRKSSNCLYKKRTYSKHVPTACTGQTKVKIISSIELPINNIDAEQQNLKRSSSTDAGNSPNSEKLPVSWNILSQNDAAHLNLQTYGMDPNVTYVPARRMSSHINNYTASKQMETRGARTLNGARANGVLQPARVPKYHRKTTARQPRYRDVHHRDHTVDLTEEGEEQNLIKYRDKFKCSICIEGLQVADPEPIPIQKLRFQPRKSYWPTHIEYSAGDPIIPVSVPGATSDSLKTYKDDKIHDKEPAPFRLNVAGSRTNLAVSGNTSGNLSGSRTNLTLSGSVANLDVSGGSVGKLILGSGQMRDSSARIGKTNLLDLKQLVIKERACPSVGIQRKPRQASTSSERKKCSLEKSCKILKKLHSERGENKVPSLYDRFQATKSGKRQRKMYGVSICDVYEGSQESPQDMFNYGLFLTSPLATPPTKQKLDPLMNIRPLYASNLQTH